MRILIIVPSYKPAYVYGGPIESVAKLCEGLAADCNEVDVYTTTANGDEELRVKPGQAVDVDGVMVTYFRRLTKDHSHISPSLWLSLFKNVKKYDIVHIQSWWSPLVVVAALICVTRRVRFVLSPRGMLSKYVMTTGHNRIKKFLHLTVGRFVLSHSILHATSKAEFEECRQVIPGWKGFILPNILSLPDIPLERRPGPKFTMLFMSRIHPKKGLELLFKAMSLVRADVTLRVAGSGEEHYIENLKSLAVHLGIFDRIEWLGWLDRSQKFNALLDADLLVLPSYNENFANVVIEALHMGTAVMITKEVALSDFVVRNNLGWIIARDSENIIENLNNVISDVCKLNDIRKRGRSAVSQSFGHEKLITGYRNAYTKAKIGLRYKGKG